MAWVVIDDHCDEHPKIARLDAAGFGLFVAGLCYCNRHLTDGFIPAGMAYRLIGGAPENVDQLILAGVWDAVEGGYQVHDYLDWQRSREQVHEERERGRERAAKSYANRRHSSGEEPAKKQTSSPDPNPNPQVSPSGDTHSAEIAAVWAAYEGYSPRSVLTKARRDLIARRLKDHPVDVLVAAIHGNRQDEWHSRVGKHDLEYVFRNAGLIERFAQTAAESPVERLSRKGKLSARELAELGAHLDGQPLGLNPGEAA